MLTLGSSAKCFMCIILLNLLNEMACIIIYPICQTGEQLHCSLSDGGRSSTPAEMTEPKSFPTISHCLPYDGSQRSWSRWPGPSGLDHNFIANTHSGLRMVPISAKPPHCIRGIPLLKLWVQLSEGPEDIRKYEFQLKWRRSRSIHTSILKLAHSHYLSRPPLSICRGEKYWRILSASIFFDGSKHESYPCWFLVWRSLRK